MVQSITFLKIYPAGIYDLINLRSNKRTEKMIAKRVCIIVCALVLAFLLAMPGVSMAGDKPQINYIGSSTVGKFIKEASKAYTDAAFTLNTKVESGGGERGIAMGKADIGGVAREVGQNFLNKGVTPVLIGKDAIGVWVNQKNPVADLNSQQLEKIFLGEIKNWKEVGGDDLPITVYIVDINSATWKVFTKKVLGGKRYGGDVKLCRPDSDVVNKVAGDAGGIGHLSFALGDTHTMRSQVKKVAIDGQEPTVNNPNYPITRPLYLITKGQPNEKSKAFIDWTLSGEGQKIVKKFFVGI
ncbi:MAG: phosphate ABC transporter substrate-binding protein [Desulfobacterales bacterium]|nr:phosphate ABC transporter substrate-binding protein [Desulfobacterales bacterium]